MKLLLLKNSTSKIIHIKVEDATSTTGAGLTGLVYNTAGLVAYFIRLGDVGTGFFPLAAGTLGTWSSGGFKEVGAPELPGLYEVGLPNSVFSSGADSVVVVFRGAANMVPCWVEIQCLGADLNDAAGLGLSRLDAAVTSRMATFTLPANFSSLAVDVSGRVDLSKWLGSAVNGLVAGRVDANAQAAAAGLISATVFSQGAADLAWSSATRTLTAATNLTSTGGTITVAAGAVTAGTVGDKTGYSLAAAGLDAIAVTDPGAPTGHTTIPKMVVALWRWFYKKTTLTSTTLRTFADDNTAVNASAAVSDDGTTQTKGPLS